HYSWRITYGVIALLGLLTFAALYFWLPTIANRSNGNLTQQLSYFKQPKAWLIIAIISIGTGGLFSWICYISPMVTKVGNLAEERVALIMVLVGLGMFFGNILGGKLADTISPTKASIACFSAMAITLVAVYFTAHIPEMAYIMAFVSGLVAFTTGSPLQMMLINSAKGSDQCSCGATSKSQPRKYIGCLFWWYSYHIWFRIQHSGFGGCGNGKYWCAPCVDISKKVSNERTSECLTTFSLSILL